MLTDGQIDYLLQLRKSKDRIPNDTVRIMLSALRWSDGDIDRALAFINKQFDTENQKNDHVALASEAEIDTNISQVVAPAVNIKQNPFPVGSPFHQNLKKIEELKGNRHALLGVVFGLFVFLAGVLAFSFFLSK